MKNGLKCSLASAVLFAAGFACLTSDSGTSATTAKNASGVSVSRGVQSLDKAPTDDQLASRVRRHNRRVLRRTT